MQMRAVFQKMVKIKAISNDSITAFEAAHALGSCESFHVMEILLSY